MEKKFLSDQEWLNDVYHKALGKLHEEYLRVKSDIPYIPLEGRYRDCMMPDGLAWWTNGFWPGILWQLYHVTGDEQYRDTAIQVEDRLAQLLTTFEGLDHDIGFLFMPSSVAHYRADGNEESLRRGVHAAHILSARFNCNGSFIRAWDQTHWKEDVSGWMIVDCMMNIPLLFWASEVTGDPRFSSIANRHAQTAMHTLLQADGSSGHIASFNPVTGEFLGCLPGQGYGEGSAWSRGQGWALYGFALAYRYTGNKEYLDASKRCAHLCIANLAVSDWLPLVDFRAPAQPIRYDSGAGVLLACGLLELSEHVPELEKNLFQAAALRVLRASEEKFADWDFQRDGILGGGATMYHNDRLAGHAYIYNDYFLLEGILRFKNKATRIW